MKKLVIMIVFLFLLFTGYNNSSFNKYMEEGKEALINKEYKKSRELLKKAINRKSDDKEAIALHKQVEKLIEAIKLKKEGNLQEAMYLCQNINNIESEDKTIQNVARNIKDECNKDLQEFEMYKDVLNERIEMGKYLMDSGNNEEAKNIFSELISEIGDEEAYYLQLEEIKNYLSMCEE